MKFIEYRTSGASDIYFNRICVGSIIHTDESEFPWVLNCRYGIGSHIPMPSGNYSEFHFINREVALEKLRNLLGISKEELVTTDEFNGRRIS